MITFTVSKDRRQVKCSECYSVLKHFRTGEAQAIKKESVAKKSKTWWIQLGPFAQHKIHLERKSASSKIIKLSIDDEVLCEASGEDIESDKDWWTCEFRFLGEKFYKWHVYNCNNDGVTQNSTGTVLERTVYA